MHACTAGILRDTLVRADFLHIIAEQATLSVLQKNKTAISLSKGSECTKYHAFYTGTIISLRYFDLLKGLYFLLFSFYNWIG